MLVRLRNASLTCHGEVIYSAAAIFSLPQRFTEQVDMTDTFIREMLHSNLGWDTGYPDGGFSCFITVPTAKLRYNTPISHNRLLQNPFKFINLAIQRYISKYRQRIKINHKPFQWFVL
jgi:hypothetical protein